MGVSDWFETRLVADKTWAIDDHGCDVIYLVAGDERALLIDTGWGIGGLCDAEGERSCSGRDLPGLVASLTDLPLLVVNTHGHPDHSVGNWQFERVHMHESDIQMTGDWVPSLEWRCWVAQNVLSDVMPPGFDLEAWATSVPELVPIREGHVFDLGRRALEVIAVPGHTPGSICLLDRQHRLLFVGDTVLRGAVALNFDECLPLRAFHTNLWKLQGYADAFDGLLPGHAGLADLPLPKGLIDKLVDGIAQILDGTLAGRRERTAIGEGLRCDFGTCGITYRADRLGAPTMG
jgi:glyoxylase-like metal-dependent hydrolase (beta-lactamase superfamily II)